MASETYSSVIPALARGLAVLRAYIDRVEAAAAEVCASDEHYLQARLAPDMSPFIAQLQLASDTAKGAAARLAGVEPPVFDDNETTIAQIRARIDRTIAYLNSFDPVEFVGASDRLIDQRFRDAPFAMRGADYIENYVFPNFYFHVATAHAILRNNAVGVGKIDYLGQMKGQPLSVMKTGAPRIRFLTGAQGNAWLAAYDMAIAAGPDTDKEPMMVNFGATPVREAIAALLGGADFSKSGLLIRFTDWIWDDEYDSDPTGPIRAAHHENRDLAAVPAWVFPAASEGIAHDVLELIIERNWTAIVYAPDECLSIHFEGNGDVAIMSSDDVVTERIRQRLSTLGVN